MATESLLSLAVLIPLCPFAAFLMILLFGRKLPGKGAGVAIAWMVVAWLLMLCVDAGWMSRLATGGENPQPFHSDFLWMSLGQAGQGLTAGYQVDSATAVMLFVVTTVGTLIFIFASGYMAGDPWYPRFFAYLSLFAAAMLGVVVSNSLLVFFVCWEIMGLCSYFLIGFWYDRPSAMRAAKKAFVVTRVGDVGFFIGILTLYLTTTTHSLTFSDIFTPAEVHHLFLTRWTFMGFGFSAATAIALMVFCGSIGKSAQFPLHVWLPDAMEGPTPVSALIHAATMVAAGVYLVARMYPLFVEPARYGSHYSAPLVVVAGVGAFTAVFAATMGLPNNDIKKVLAYSTISQLGYMFTALGCFGWTAALFHLMTHAFFKALLFLGAGSIYHATHTYDMRQMGGLRQKMPKTAWTYLIGCLALSGVFPLSGFWSKDAILGEAFRAHGPYYAFIFFLAVFGALLTAFYTFRMYFMVFEGQPRDQHIYDHVHESEPVMTTPLLVLAAGASVLGLIGIPWEVFSRPLEGLNFFGTKVRFYELPQNVSTGETPWMTLGLWLFSTAVAALGIWLAYRIYLQHTAPAPENRGWRRYGLQGWYNTAARLYYMDDFYRDTLVSPTLNLSSMSGSFDTWFIDNILVNGAAAVTVFFSRLNDWFDRTVVDGVVRVVGGFNLRAGEMLRNVQQGVIQIYALVVFISVFALVIVVRYMR